MKTLVIGLIFGICLPFIAAYVFIISGGMPVSTKSPPLPLERFITGLAIHAATKGEMNVQAPFSADSAHLLEGAKVYREQCMMCHGIPDHPASTVAQGLFPGPPQFFKPSKMHHDHPLGGLFWKIKNGIRLTGMPGFVDNLSEEQLWDLTLLIHQSQSLPDEVKKSLSQ